MARPKTLTFSPSDEDLTHFASNVTGATFTLTENDTPDGLAHQVGIRNDSATDHSGKTVTLVGTDQDGRALTEVVTGPGSSATVESSGYFKTLTSATPSATIGADTFDIGIVDEFSSQTVPLNVYKSNIGIAINVTGTINYTLQQTLDKLETVAATSAAFKFQDSDDATVVSATDNQNTNYVLPPTAARLKVNSYSSGATISIDITQANG